MFRSRKSRNLRKKSLEESEEENDDEDNEIAIEGESKAGTPKTRNEVLVLTKDDPSSGDGEEGARVREKGRKKKKKKYKEKNERQRRGFGSSKVEFDERTFATAPASSGSAGAYTEEGLKRLAEETFANAPAEIVGGSPPLPAWTTHADPGFPESEYTAAQARALRSVNRTKEQDADPVPHTETKVEDFIPLDGSRKVPSLWPTEHSFDEFAGSSKQGQNEVRTAQANEAFDHTQYPPSDPEEDQWQMEQLRRAGLQGEADDVLKSARKKNCASIIDKELSKDMAHMGLGLSDAVELVQIEMQNVSAQLEDLEDSNVRETKASTQAGEDAVVFKRQSLGQDDREELFRELLDYFNNLLEMLAEKGPMIEERVELSKKEWKTTGKRRDLRRRKDFLEEAEENGVESNVVLPSDSEDSSSSSSSSSSSTASSSSSAVRSRSPSDQAQPNGTNKGHTVGDVLELDEFGRELTGVRKTHAEERRERRLERRSNRRAARTEVLNPEGWSTSEDESPPAIDNSTDILEEVSAEYATLHSVLNVCERWRNNSLDSYSEAFRSGWIEALCLPFVQLDVASWNVLSDPNLKSLESFRDIRRYSEHSPYSSDSNLLPNIALGEVLPVTSNFITFWLDQSSERENEAGIEVFREMVRTTWTGVVHHRSRSCSNGS
uniref:GCF C-terminal domain-containing protein n=1 Tax=Rhodosorus marinus TaxID=101924 RepID=A0A7S2ZNC4_9RHOD|mmetsp:Transcript_23070/g.92299  ORF Transcript_23070/g.92299 Transcript_23070/m.92299 type:complete len:664 (+) Transcript_23070:44-2035(+)